MTPKERITKLRICAVGSCLGGLLLLSAGLFFVPRYLYLRSFLDGKGNVVMFSNEQYEGLLHAWGALWFAVFPMFGLLLLFSAWLIWRATKYVSETSD
jgi:hypothetical protein